MSSSITQETEPKEYYLLILDFTGDPFAERNLPSSSTNVYAVKPAPYEQDGWVAVYDRPSRLAYAVANGLYVNNDTGEIKWSDSPTVLASVDLALKVIHTFRARLYYKYLVESATVAQSAVEQFLAKNIDILTPSEATQ